MQNVTRSIKFSFKKKFLQNDFRNSIIFIKITKIYLQHNLYCIINGVKHTNSKRQLVGKPIIIRRSREYLYRSYIQYL